MKNDCNRCKKVYELPTIQSKKIVEIIYYGQSEIEGIQSTGQIFFLGYLCNRCEKKVMADIKKIVENSANRKLWIKKHKKLI